MDRLNEINSIISSCLETDPKARGAAIREFAQLYSDETGMEMALQLKNNGKEQRARAMEALAAASPASLPLLISLMEDGDWIVRYRAAEALGLSGDAGAVETLRSHLTDTKDHVRYMAVKSLGLLHGEVAAEEIAERLCTDENPYVRRMAVRTLARMAAADYADLFRCVRQTEGDATVIAALDEALEGMGENV
ncbi:hypothetical protein AZH53_05645 [Methanomicrobiaceae archaeon CYW5]|uniref:HEAT repeat domain-containing protein n=1 Tax=Methanovulcanius yangii TaxID=1789227 RepID=UPI0029CA00FD|nr:HEAT repeat domain-containing protein [Methanovulcanius yangii]MBT8507896.1 hypothetical protein [Methanovulcanius yangii]